MQFNWLKTRQTKYTGYVTLYILVIVAVLGSANYLANGHNKSLDTTANKRFSLSDQTEKVVKNLKQDVKVSYFDRTSEFARAKDLLDRYDNLSGKLKVEYVDPDKKPQIAKAMGVRTYGTIYVQAGAKREEAKSLTEEELTGAIIRALKSGPRKVYFVTGAGEHSLEDTGRTGYSTLKETLEKNNYTTAAVSLIEKPEVPKDATILVVGGPRLDYTQPVVNAIKTYVENGGHVLFMLDPPLSMGRDNTSENPALAKLLADWGVEMSKNLVLDTSGVGQLFGLGPEAPLVLSYESHPIVREMKEVATVFPLARSLQTKTVDKVTDEKLFSTSGNSFATSNLASAEIRIDPKKDTKGPFTLAAAGTYNNKGRFVVVGSSSWVTNSFLPARSLGNRDLALNMMNWLSSDEDLISIRPKDPEDRRLSLNRTQMTRVFYSSVIFLPLMVIGAGFAVWWRRR